MLQGPSVSRPGLVLCLALALAPACGVSGGGGSFTIQAHRTSVSVAASTTAVFGGKNLVFFADEATTGTTGTDMNADGDTIDSIAVVVDMSTNVETNLGVAAITGAWIGNELYLVVDESLDEHDWNNDADQLDLVLLHVSAATPAAVPDFVDRISAAGTTKIAAYGTNLFYTSARAPIGPGDSNVLVLTTATPLAPAAVATQDTGTLTPRILGKDEGLVFFGLDETIEGRDLNGDGDATDTNVLALLDGALTATAGLYGGAIHSTGLAMPASTFVMRARRTSASSHDWRVGFTVSEAAQGGTNLNAPGLFAGTWKPSQCNTFEDTDATDAILHFLNFLAWDADDVTNPPVNTGLVSCRKIAISNNYIATISPEHDVLPAEPNGAEGNCDLNGDGDRADYVVRWVQMSATVLPLTPAAHIHALTNVAGGTFGLAELGSQFAIEVSEAADNLDINGDAQKTLDIIGWLTPSGSANANTPWDFVLGSSNSTFAGASWISEAPDRSRLGLAMQEKVMGRNINGPPTFPNLPDTDTLDSVPTFPLPSFPTLPGVAIAVQTGNAGIVIARATGFYRVAETEDDSDWNSDGDQIDYVLRGTTLSQGFSSGGGVLNSLARPAIDLNTDESVPYGASYLADEQMQGAGMDLNGDGDATDLVLTWFRF